MLIVPKNLYIINGAIGLTKMDVAFLSGTTMSSAVKIENSGLSGYKLAADGTPGGKVYFTDDDTSSKLVPVNVGDFIKLLSLTDFVGGKFVKKVRFGLNTLTLDPRILPFIDEDGLVADRHELQAEPRDVADEYEVIEPGNVVTCTGICNKYIGNYETVQKYNQGGGVIDYMTGVRNLYLQDTVGMIKPIPGRSKLVDLGVREGPNISEFEYFAKLFYDDRCATNIPIKDSFEIVFEHLPDGLTNYKSGQKKQIGQSEPFYAVAGDKLPIQSGTGVRVRMDPYTKDGSQRNYYKAPFLKTGGLKKLLSTS